MKHRLVILGAGESGVGAALLGKKEGYDVEVIWSYDARDTDMKESGEEFSSYVPELSVKYVEY